MAIRKIATLCTLILMGFLTIKETMGTSCELQHPQTAVCRAKFVIKGKVLDTNWQPSAKNGERLPSLFKPRYIKVELRKIYKGAKSIYAKKYSKIYIRFASLERPLLEEDHLYVLSGYSFGTSLFMNSCSWNSKWSKLTSGQRLGITKYFYWIYCGCRIVDFQNKAYADGKRSCVWNRQNTAVTDFLAKDGICMVTNGTSCKWNFGL